MYWQKIYKWWFPRLLIYFYSSWIHFYLILDKNIGGFYNFYSILYLHSVLIFTSDGDDVAGPWSFSVLTVIRYSVALSKPTIKSINIEKLLSRFMFHSLLYLYSYTYKPNDMMFIHNGSHFICVSLEISINICQIKIIFFLDYFLVMC